jgi:flagellar biogenesis protein FliO
MVGTVGKLLVQTLIIMVMIYVVKKVIAAAPVPQAVKNFAEGV